MRSASPCLPWSPAIAPQLALRVAILVNMLHGICYAFFFATVYIFVDEFFPKDARSSAQGLFNFLILGVGPFVGNFAGTAPGQRLQGGMARLSSISLFLVPAAIALGGSDHSAVLLPPPAKKQVTSEDAPRRPINAAGDCPGSSWPKQSPELNPAAGRAAFNE